MRPVPHRAKSHCAHRSSGLAAPGRQQHAEAEQGEAGRFRHGDRKVLNAWELFEIDSAKVEFQQGMYINFVTTARTDREGQRLLSLFGMPFRAAAESGQ